MMSFQSSGKQAESPDVDRADWFSINMAKQKLLKGQRRVFIRALRNIEI